MTPIHARQSADRNSRRPIRHGANRGLNVRLAARYYGGSRELPPKRLAQLIDALRHHGTHSTALANKVAEHLEDP